MRCKLWKISEKNEKLRNSIDMRVIFLLIYIRYVRNDGGFHNKRYGSFLFIITFNHHKKYQKCAKETGFCVKTFLV